MLIAFALLALVGTTALVVSAGQLYWERRRAQELADAGALAGAAMVPCSGQNAYAAVDGVVAAQLGVATSLPQVSGPCGSGPSSWSRTYPDGTQVTVTHPYVSTSRVLVTVVSAQIQLPFGAVLGASQSTVAARAVAQAGGASPPANYALYVQEGISCSGSLPTDIYGSIYSGGPIDTNCTIYTHVLRDALGNLSDPGNVLVYPAGQQWTKGGGACVAGTAVGNVTCADGYEISRSTCPSPAGVTDFLGVARVDYPCPSWGVPATDIGAFSSPEPNQDPNVLATIGGVPCDPAAGAAVYQTLTIGATVVGRMRRVGTYQPVRDAAGYYHVRPGCYGWLDLSLILSADPSAKPQVVFDPGFYYFSGFKQSSDKSGGQGAQSAGGLCLNSGTRAVGRDVLFEMVDTSSFSSSSCDASPTSSTSSGFGADPAVPVVDGGVQYAYLAAPCDPVANPKCPLPSGSAWCPPTDRACNATLIWTPAGPPATALTRIAGTFYAKGPAEQSWLYGTIYWAGEPSGGTGCQWTANGTAAIVGQLICQSALLQGGSSTLAAGIVYARTDSNNAPAQAGLVE